MTVLSFFIFNPIGRWISIAVLAASALGGIYTKGQYDGRQAVKARINAEKKSAIEKGHQGTIDALKKLDTDSIPGWWFRD